MQHGAPGARHEVRCFVQLCVGALAVLLRRRLLPPQQLPAAVRAAAASALFAPDKAEPLPSASDARLANNAKTGTPSAAHFMRHGGPHVGRAVAWHWLPARPMGGAERRGQGCWPLL